MGKISLAFMEIEPPYISSGANVGVELSLEAKNKEKNEVTKFKVSIQGTSLPLFLINEDGDEVQNLELRTEVTNRWKKYEFPLTFKLAKRPTSVTAVLIQVVAENASGGVATELTNVVCQ